MTPPLDQIYQGDVLDVLRSWPAEFIQAVVTSPPYWGLRDYGVAGQLGLEESPAAYVAKMVEVFRGVRRVLKKNGTLWLNLGDSYAQSGMGGNPAESAYRKQATNAGSLIPGRKPPVGLKSKDLVGIPWRVAFALQADGWYLRSDIIWAKPNPMPESVTDRPTKAHEYLFLLAKSERYYYDAQSIAEPVTLSTIERVNQPGWEEQEGSDRVPGKTNGPMKAVVRKDLPETQAKLAQFWDEERRTNAQAVTRNARTVWPITTTPFKEAHFATFPLEIPRRCIMAGSRSGGGDVVLDPFMGAGTTAVVAKRLKRSSLGIELNPAYIEIANRRIAAEPIPLLVEGAA